MQNKKGFYNLLVICLILTVFVSRTNGQYISNFTDTKNRVYWGIGIDPNLNMVFGYQKMIDIKGIKEKSVLFAEWKPSVIRFGIKNWDFKTGLTIPVLHYKKFAIVNNIFLSAGRLDTRNFVSFRIAAGDKISAGFFFRKAYIALNAEYKRYLLTHLKHTDFYREVFYEDAKDGWYKSTGGMFQFGIESGFRIAENINMDIEIKMPFTEKFNGYGGSPCHLNISIGYLFGSFK